MDAASPTLLLEGRDYMYIKSSRLATAPGGKKDISRSEERVISRPVRSFKMGGFELENFAN